MQYTGQHPNEIVAAELPPPSRRATYATSHPWLPSPMDSKIDIADAYRAYNRILTDGTRDGDARHYRGLTAYTDFDGYGVTLSDGLVSARLLFHSRIKVSAPDRRALQRFVRLLKELAAEAAGGEPSEQTLREHRFDA